MTTYSEPIECSCFVCHAQTQTSDPEDEGWGEDEGQWYCPDCLAYSVDERGAAVCATHAEEKRYTCGCGLWVGQPCEASPMRRSEMVVVEWMPQQYRASHVAARCVGHWPHNGAVRVRVHPECAGMILRHDPSWTSIESEDRGAL